MSTIEKTNTCCDIFQPIYPSRNDTKETKKQIYIHNELYEEICGQHKEEN